MIKASSITSMFMVLFFLCIFITKSHSQTLINVPMDYPSIQEGLTHAADGDTVLVAPGHYIENIDFGGKNVCLASHYLLTGDKSFVEQTIIDGNQERYVVLFSTGETSEAQLVGFTIMGGTHDPDLGPFPAFGGGIVCLGASPTIRHNFIRKCNGNVFNYSNFGAIYCQDSEALIEYNTIDSIEAFFTQKLGGIVSDRSNLTISSNVIRNINGGYVFQGGGISADSSMLDIQRNIIERCAFDVAPYSASIRLFNSEATIIHNTLIGEVAFNELNSATLVNNIIVSAEVDGEGIVELNESNASIEARYNNLKWNTQGEGNNDVDPGFVDAENGDFHLEADSPCIDSGDPDSPLDPDDTRADKGALYFQQISNSTGNNAFDFQVSIAPNPATDLVKIISEQPLQDLSLSVFAVNGQEIFRRNMPNSDGSFSLKELPKGIYLIKVFATGKESNFIKLVKQ